MKCKLNNINNKLWFSMMLLLFFLIVTNSIYAKERIILMNIRAVDCSEEAARDFTKILKTKLQLSDKEMVSEALVRFTFKDLGISMDEYCSSLDCSIQALKKMKANTFIYGSLHQKGSRGLYYVTLYSVKKIITSLGKDGKNSTDTTNVSYKKRLITKGDSLLYKLQVDTSSIVNKIYGRVEKIAVKKKGTKIAKNNINNKKFKNTSYGSNNSSLAGEGSFSLFEIRSNGSFLLPLGTFADMVQPGFGINTQTSVKYFSLFSNQIFLNINSGVYYFSGALRNVNSLAMIPVTVSAHVNFNVFKNVFIGPEVGAGVLMSVLDYGKNNGGEYNYSSEFYADLMTSISFNVGYRLFSNVTLSTSLSYILFFEEGDTGSMTSAGVGVNYRF